MSQTRTSKPVHLTPKAREDLEEIWIYTATTWSVDQAERYTNQIIDAFDALATAPERATDVSDLRDGYLRWSIGRHYIFFRDLGDALEVVRILHQSRDHDRHV